MENQEELQKLTKEIAISEVSYIHHISRDDEAAHSSEDSLHRWFIECVAANLYDSIEEMVEVANIVKSTSEIDFNRWYA